MPCVWLNTVCRILTTNKTSKHEDAARNKVALRLTTMASATYCKLPGTCSEPKDAAIVLDFEYVKIC